MLSGLAGIITNMLHFFIINYLEWNMQCNHSCFILPFKSFTNLILPLLAHISINTKYNKIPLKQYNMNRYTKINVIRFKLRIVLSSESQAYSLEIFHLNNNDHNIVAPLSSSVLFAEHYPPIFTILEKNKKKRTQRCQITWPKIVAKI
jgi:hypothetical protein